MCCPLPEGPDATYERACSIGIAERIVARSGQAFANLTYREVTTVSMQWPKRDGEAGIAKGAGWKLTLAQVARTLSIICMTELNPSKHICQQK